MDKKKLNWRLNNLVKVIPFKAVFTNSTPSTTVPTAINVLGLLHFSFTPLSSANLVFILWLNCGNHVVKTLTNILKNRGSCEEAESHAHIMLMPHMQCAQGQVIYTCA